MEEDFNGILEEDLNGVLEEDLNGVLEEDFNGVLEKDFNGILEEDFNGVLEEDLNGVLEEDFNGVLEEEFNGVLGSKLRMGVRCRIAYAKCSQSMRPESRPTHQCSFPDKSVEEYSIHQSNLAKNRYARILNLLLNLNMIYSLVRNRKNYIIHIQ